MKRIQAACICQTLHFQLKDGISNTFNIRAVQEEVKRYKESLNRSRTKYQILEETTQQDGSVVMKLMKQYNSSPVGDYFKTMR